jgi:hypothetical protein
MSAKHKHARATLAPLPPPPAWLREVPDSLLEPHRLGGRPDRLLDWLARHSITARPTLAEIEAERARRGIRALAVSTKPAPAVLPMPADVLTHRARTNRARIVEALDGLTLADVDRLVDQIRDEARRASAEARREEARRGRAA